MEDKLWQSNWQWNKCFTIPCLKKKLLLNVGCWLLYSVADGLPPQSCVEVQVYRVSKVKIVGKLQSNSMSTSDRCNTFSQAHPIAKGKPFIRSRQTIYVQMLSSNGSLLNKLYHCSLSQRYVLPNYLLIRLLPIDCHSERVIASL